MAQDSDQSITAGYIWGSLDRLQGISSIELVHSSEL